MSSRVMISGVDTTKLPKISNSELELLMARVKSGDEKAREQFVVANLRLVLSVVHKFGAKGNMADDMFQVGCVGLMKAIDNFDASLCVKFSTYAVPMIVGEIRRYLRDNSSLRVSRSLRDIAYKALQAKENLSKNSFKEPTIDEISKEIDMPAKSVIFALDAISEPISLYERAYDGDNDSVLVMDQITDYQTEDNMLNSSALKEALSSLNKREKQIVIMRYYLGKTQTEISEEIGISQAQVSRLEKDALSFIKQMI